MDILFNPITRGLDVDFWIIQDWIIKLGLEFGIPRFNV